MQFGGSAATPQLAVSLEGKTLLLYDLQSSESPRLDTAVELSFQSYYGLIAHIEWLDDGATLLVAFSQGFVLCLAAGRHHTLPLKGKRQELTAPARHLCARELRPLGS